MIAGTYGNEALMGDKKISDVGANPQDQEFGTKAAEDIERAEHGEAPVHDNEDVRAGGKAKPDSE